MAPQTVKVAISSDLLTAFANLPHAQQTKARQFIDKFQKNPTSPGINYETITHARDPNLRSVRIDQAYRGIVLKPQSGDVYLLLWIDRHDDAYAWAQHRVCTIHPETGSVQVVFVAEEEKTTTEEPPQQEAASLFQEVRDKHLLRLGVPETLIETMRGITSAEELHAQQATLPEEAFEALTFLANGELLDDVLNTYGVKETDTPVNTEDYSKALENPDSLRRFYVVDDENELQAILNAPLEKWRVFLHPSQRKLVERDWNGPVRVLGGAGTGKTVVAIHRARWLVQHRITEKKERILFTTFTRNLAADIKENLSKLCPPEQMQRIEVVNLDRWVSDFLKKHGYRCKISYGDETKKWWMQALSKATLEGIPESFYREEWEQVILPQEIMDRKGYLKASRVGRGVRLDTPKRKEVWKVFEEYRALLDENDLREAEDAMREARQILEQKGDILPYRAILVDEAQDMGYQAFRLLRQIIPQERMNDMMIVGDAHQRIYNKKVILSRCGIQIVGRSHKLRINYRTTEEIRRWAVEILQGQKHDDLDGGEDSSQEYTSLMHGNPPMLRRFDHLEQEVEFLAAAFKQLNEDGLKDTCLVTRTKTLLERYKGMLEAKGIPTYSIQRSEAEDRTKKGLRIATMHRVKGLEFERLYLPGLNQDAHSAAALEQSEDITIHEEAEQRERSLLHVALTRARKEAVVTYYGKPSPLLPKQDRVW